MMNKYIELIDSTAIRDYLNEIGYIPSIFDIVYIIEKNKKITLNEKHKLWNEIIGTMHDEKLEKELNYDNLSLHGFLNKYMQIQNMLCEQFLKKEENAVYTCSSGVVLDYDSREPLINDPFYWCNIYTDLELCIRDVLQQQHRAYDVRKHYIKTNFDNVDYKCIWADLTQDGDIMDIEELFVLNHNDSELYQFFKSKTISIPIPFKKGDLIYSKTWDLADYKLMKFKNYKNGFIYVTPVGEENKEFSIVNDLNIEFVDKEQCIRVLKEAFLFRNDSLIEFIIKTEILNKQEIADIVQECEL